MAMSLANRVALITGGSAGLGAATAKAFAALKMNVVINYSHDSKRAETLIEGLKEIAGSTQNGGHSRFIAIKADVSSKSELYDLVNATISYMGRLDVVCSNHGWTRLSDFNDLDSNVNDEDWDKCFNMNVKSHLYLMHAAKKHLEEQEGSFIVTSSVAGVRPAGSSLVSLRVSISSLNADTGTNRHMR